MHDGFVVLQRQGDYLRESSIVRWAPEVWNSTATWDYHGSFLELW
jgi:hypothetical protein